MRALLAVLLAALLFAAQPALAAEPSFDCAKARSADEIAICNDEELAQMDRLAALAYEEARRASGRGKALAAARVGIAARGECGSDEACIMAAQTALIQEFQALGANVEIPATDDASKSGGSASPAAGDGSAGGLPAKVGQCVNTAIARITSRFQDDIHASPDDGSAVSFENGGAQVSYDKEQALIHSRVGDPVLMCLVEVPQNCPPGDDRGKIFTTTNLRTQESWTLPDSQHSCGGA